MTVVASIATQMTPMLFAHTARTIAATNAGVSTPYSRAPFESVWPCCKFGVDVSDAGPGGQRGRPRR